MAKLRLNKSVRSIVDLARSLGFSAIEVVHRKRHYQLRAVIHDRSIAYVIPVSGSDWRGPKNLAADLRRISAGAAHGA